MTTTSLAQPLRAITATLLPMPATVVVAVVAVAVAVVVRPTGNPSHKAKQYNPLSDGTISQKVTARSD